MAHHVAPIACKPWALNGLSERLITSHYENHYGAAVRSLNAIRDELNALDLAAAPAYRILALKREELAALGSVALHELYFGSLGGDGGVLFTGSGAGTKIPAPVSEALELQFGSVAAWVVGDRLAAASGAGVRGRGNAADGALPSVSVEELSAELAKSERVQVLDARPKFHLSRGTDMMRGAIWRDPERVDEWSRELTADAPVFVYCSYGYHVGCGVTAALRERGFDARYIRGGLSAWYAAGGAREPRPHDPAR